MRPPSIVNFERFYLGAFVVGLLGTFLAWDYTIAQVQAEMPPELELGSTFVIASIAIGAVVTLLLWYFVARRASVVAKWIVVVFFAIALLNLVSIFASGAMGTIGALPLLLSILGIVLEALAVWMLFRPDAGAWFGGSGADVLS